MANQQARKQAESENPSTDSIPPEEGIAPAKPAAKKPTVKKSAPKPVVKKQEEAPQETPNNVKPPVGVTVTPPTNVGDAQSGSHKLSEEEPSI